MYMYMYIYIYMYMIVYVYVYVYLYVCMYLCLCLCLRDLAYYVYNHIHTFTIIHMYYTYIDNYIHRVFQSQIFCQIFYDTFVASSRRSTGIVEIHLFQTNFTHVRNGPSSVLLFHLPGAALFNGRPETNVIQPGCIL